LSLACQDTFFFGKSPGRLFYGAGGGILKSCRGAPQGGERGREGGEEEGGGGGGEGGGGRRRRRKKEPIQRCSMSVFYQLQCVYNYPWPDTRKLCRDSCKNSREGEEEEGQGEAGEEEEEEEEAYSEEKDVEEFIYRDHVKVLMGLITSPQTEEKKERILICIHIYTSSCKCTCVSSHLHIMMIHTCIHISTYTYVHTLLRQVPSLLHTHPPTHMRTYS
jgi:hypothetical protein